jgi:hypothetical protein
MTIRFEDQRRLGSLQLQVDLSGLPISLSPDGHPVPVCEALVPGMMIAAGAQGTTLNIGMISEHGFSGPADVARCRIFIYAPVPPGPLPFSVYEATDDSLQELDPPPVVVLRAGN